MPAYRPDAALIVQSDGTILAEVAAPDYPAARGKLARFAELEKSPEHVHTYRVTPLSLWNAAASGMSAEEIVAALEAHSKYDLPSNVLTHVREQLGRYGRVRIESGGAPGTLRLVTADALVAETLSRSKVAPLFGPRLEPTVFELPGIASRRMRPSRARSAASAPGAWPTGSWTAGSGTASRRGSWRT